MRVFLLIALLLCVASCVHDDAVEDPARAPLTAALIPIVAHETTFDVGRDQLRAFHQEVLSDAAVRWSVESVGVLTDVTRMGDSFYFSDGPRTGTELIRLGARPGTRWESDDQQVLFHGWERIEVPAGTYDAARIVTVSGPANFANRVTWWFAEGVGLVQIEYDRAGVDIKRLARAAP